MTQFITSNLENHNQIQQTGFTANLNALFPRPPLMPKHREWHIQGIRCLTFLLWLRYLLFVTRNHIASNLTKFMAT
jgi:hypothetical protein